MGTHSVGREDPGLLALGLGLRDSIKLLALDQRAILF